MGELTWIVCSCNPKTWLLCRQYNPCLSCLSSMWLALIWPVCSPVISISYDAHGDLTDPVLQSEYSSDNPCESRLTVKGLQKGHLNHRHIERTYLGNLEAYEPRKKHDLWDVIEINLEAYEPRKKNMVIKRTAKMSWSNKYNRVLSFYIVICLISGV